MQKLDQLKAELIQINSKIEKLTRVSDYTDLVAKSFHLGMVGGSGKNIGHLNRKRAESLDRTISNAVKITSLFKKQGDLERQIKDIEQNGPQKRAAAKKTRNEIYAQYWKDLKVGDELNLGNPNGNPIITKKNAKSCETSGGCKWMACEVIGKEAAKLL